MQRYWWPGYEMQLLGGLQKQQNSTQFCDTLLQTEGISVPIHSCVLAALSPYLSQRLSASLSPPSGQKHQLQLQAVKAQTLLKLVGLLYSGELEVKGSAEQNDVLAAARQFGIADLVEGQKNGGMKELELQEKRKSRRCCRENGFQSGESRTMQDAQVQAEMAGERDTDSLSEKRSCVSTGSQTVNAGEKSVDGSVILSSQATPQTQESAPSVAQILDCSVLLQPQGITLDKEFCSTSCPVIPSLSNGAPSDGESQLNQSYGSVRNPTSTPAWSSDILTFPISLNNGSKSSRPEEDSTYQQPVEFGDSTQALAEERTVLENGKRNGKTADNRRDTEESRHANRDKMPGEERGKSSEERDAHANVGMKNLAKVQQMMETTQISIKVKLRRRTKGEVWEVVNMQDTDETSSILSSLKQNGSNHKRPETDLSDVPPPPSTIQPITAQKPDSRILQPATANSPKLPPHLNTPSDSQPPYSDCFTPNQHDGLEAAPLLQHQGSAEESDEHIEKLLEDIMMGLNILPNLERDCMKSKHLQPSHGRVPTICQVPVTQKDVGQSQVDAPVSAAGCVFHQDLGTQSCSSSTDTAHNQPGCSSLSSVLPAAASLIHQQQELSPQHHSSVRPMWHRDGVSHQSTPLSKSQECLHPETPTTRSVIPSAFLSAEQELHYPAFQEQHILEFSPLTNGNETESIHTLSLPCMDDLQLPRCLSPLESCPSATKPQPVLNNLDDQVQQKPSPQGRPWLTEKPGSVQFPLSAITERKSKSVSQDARHSRWSKQEHLDLKAQNRGTGAESCTVKKVEERSTVSAGQQNSAELKSDPREVKEGDITGDVIPPKRRRTKCTCHPQDAACSLLPFKDVKVSDSTKSQISRSVCQVSLSSNNVLVKERAMATSSLYCPSKFVGKPNQQSPITESLREKMSGVKTYPTRVRTRGFLKKNQESPWDASSENVLVAKPIVHRVKTDNIPGVTSRKRGRHSKRKLEERTPLNISHQFVAEKKNHSGESQQTTDNNLAKEDLDKTKQTCKKRWINRSTEVEVIPVKKTTSVEKTGKSEADTDIIPQVRKHGTSKRPQMVSPKEFQKLMQHSKTKKSNKSQETNEGVRGAEGEGMANRDSTWKEPPKEIEVDRDITQPRDRGGSEQSQVIVSVTVDKNHNQVFNESTDVSKKSQQDDTDGSARMEKSSPGGEDHAEFSFDVVDEEVAGLAADREQPLESSDEGTTCDTGVSNTSQQTAANDEGSSHSDIHLPQENKLPSDHNVHPQKPERTGPPLSDAGGISRTSGYHQEEEEEEDVEVEDVEVEDLEVDVLLYSPDEEPQTRGCEDGLSNTDLTPDEEEEEEDVIDVTGDEAE